MANVLQDYFDRMTALNRQRGMTGNMQYGKALDSSLAEGYFDSYEKNKAASETRANQKASLALQQQGLNMQSKAYNQSNALGWGTLAAQALGAGTKMYFGRQPTPPAITQDFTSSDPLSLNALTDQSYGGAQNVNYGLNNEMPMYDASSSMDVDPGWNIVESDFTDLYNMNW